MPTSLMADNLTCMHDKMFERLRKFVSMSTRKETKQQKDHHPPSLEKLVMSLRSHDRDFDWQALHYQINEIGLGSWGHLGLRKSRKLRRSQLWTLRNRGKGDGNVYKSTNDDFTKDNSLNELDASSSSLFTDFSLWKLDNRDPCASVNKDNVKYTDITRTPDAARTNSENLNTDELLVDKRGINLEDTGGHCSRMIDQQGELNDNDEDVASDAEFNTSMNNCVFNFPNDSLEIEDTHGDCSKMTGRDQKKELNDDGEAMDSEAEFNTSIHWNDSFEIEDSFKNIERDFRPSVSRSEEDQWGRGKRIYRNIKCSVSVETVLRELEKEWLNGHDRDHLISRGSCHYRTVSTMSEKNNLPMSTGTPNRESEVLISIPRHYIRGSSVSSTEDVSDNATVEDQSQFHSENGRLHPEVAFDVQDLTNLNKNGAPVIQSKTMFREDECDGDVWNISSDSEDYDVVSKPRNMKKMRCMYPYPAIPTGNDLRYIDRSMTDSELGLEVIELNISGESTDMNDATRVSYTKTTPGRGGCQVS